MALLLVLSFHATAREWTNAADGKKIEAEFVSSDGSNVTIKMGVKEFTLPISRFSEADQTFVKEQMAKANQPKPLEGAYVEMFTSEWALAEHDGLPYAIYGAEDLDGSKKYPVLVSLHGKSNNNENGKQIGFARQFSNEANYTQNPCIIIAPLCYQPFGATGGGWDDEPGEKALDLLKGHPQKLSGRRREIVCMSSVIPWADSGRPISLRPSRRFLRRQSRSPAARPARLPLSRRRRSGSGTRKTMPS